MATGTTKQRNTSGRRPNIVWRELAKGMQDKGITRDDLAAECKITVQAVGYWVTGVCRPDPSYWPIIMRLTDLSASDMVTQINKYFPCQK